MEFTVYWLHLDQHIKIEIIKYIIHWDSLVHFSIYSLIYGDLIQIIDETAMHSLFHWCHLSKNLERKKNP